MSTKLKLAREELEKLEVFKEYKNRTMTNMVTILGKEVPEHMAQTIANFTMASFIGHFHFKIELSFFLNQFFSTYKKLFKFPSYFSILLAK